MTPAARHVLAMCFAALALSAAAYARAQPADEGRGAGAPSEPPPTDAPPPASAATDTSAGGGDDADSIGFGAAAPATSSQPSTPVTTESEPGTLEVSGNLRHRAALWIERMGEEPFAQARQIADLAVRYKKPFHVGDDRLLLRLVGEVSAEYDFAYLHDRERFDQATLDVYEWNVIGRESYAALSWGALELTVGRQIVPWGQGQMITPLDVINPRDLREPYLAEVEDIRMAVLASRAGLFFGPHRLEAMVVHESYFGLRAPPLGDFSPLRRLILDDPRRAAALEGKTLHYENVPDRFVEGAGQFYGRYAYTGAGVDLALYAASTLDRIGVPQSPDPRAVASSSNIALPLWHPRYAMFGHSGAKPIGAVLLRWELGVELDRPLTVRTGPDQPLGMIQRHQLNAMLGLSYSGIEDTTLTLEYGQGLVLDNPERAAGDPRSLLMPVEAPALAARVTRSALRERLLITLTGMLQGFDPFVGAFGRAELDYELFEAFHAGLGYIAYFPSATQFGPLYGFERNDRLYATLRWHFVLQ